MKEGFYPSAWEGGHTTPLNEMRKILFFISWHEGDLGDGTGKNIPCSKIPLNISFLAEKPAGTGSYFCRIWFPSYPGKERSLWVRTFSSRSTYTGVPTGKTLTRPGNHSRGSSTPVTLTATVMMIKGTPEPGAPHPCYHRDTRELHWDVHFQEMVQNGEGQTKTHFSTLDIPPSLTFRLHINHRRLWW